MGTWLTTSIFGRRLMLLSFQVLRSEGDLRFDLVRVRENAGARVYRSHTGLFSMAAVHRVTDLSWQRWSNAVGETATSACGTA